MFETATTTASPLDDPDTRRVVESNARTCAAVRLALHLAFTLSSAAVAYVGSADHMRPFVPVYAATATLAAGVFVAVRRSEWVRQRQFLLLPLLDIPALTLERWAFLSHARQPVGASVIALTFYVVMVAASLLSLDRRVIAATTAGAVAGGLALTLRSDAVPILSVAGVAVLLATGAIASVMVRQTRGLLAQLAERSRELQALLTHVQDAREDERVRIARDLHDDLGQELAAMRYALAAALESAESDPRGAPGRLRALEELIGRAAQTTRAILEDLRPHALDAQGLEGALRDLCARTETRVGLACAFVASGDLAQVNAHAAIDVFRVAQESITNAARHARATSVTCTVRVTPSAVTVVVEDDGVGISAQRGRGMGLLGLRERAQARGGSLSVSRRPQGGTEVSASIPLAAPA